MIVRSLVLSLLLGSFVFAEDPAPVPPAEAGARMSLPEGFDVTLFAGEPDVVQPIAFTFDHRGRLWVVECLSYPKWDPAGKGSDRVVIFEDTDGDGRHDSRKVFLDDVGNLSGIAIGYGGVWLCSLPRVVFVPDADRDDRPDGPPKVLLDGFSLNCKHNVHNGLTWGPDGWLYGMNGILATSKVGKPGTPDDDRTPMNCGVWRYHPTKHVFEVVAHGTTNPWGLEFDDRGEIFVTNCVIKHLFHVVPGGHYERMYGQDLVANTYGLMPSCADYIHWGGGNWTTSRGGKGIHDEAGGGHAHVGCMIYRGNNWPAEYRGKLFTCNLHGNRINVDSLHRHRSGYRSKREPDFLKANSTWFRGLELKYGPDGGVFVTDWCDTGECHDYDECDVTNGRIFKITHGEVTPWRGDLTKQSDGELAALFDHENEWFARRAQVLLLDRHSTGHGPDNAAIHRLRKLALEARTPLVRQRAIATLIRTGTGTFETVHPSAHDDPAVRGWAIRQMVEHAKDIGELRRLELSTTATDERYSEVRLTFASLLPRLPSPVRKSLAMTLLRHGEDADDPNIPLMIWYGIEPLVADDPKWALEAIRDAKIPLVRQFIARRLAEVR